jgi:peptide/nickel transport system substrate-binding protein
LDQAGWVDRDGDGVREKDGEPLFVNLVTNVDNETRARLAAMVEDDLQALGFDVNLDLLNWSSVLTLLFDQQYDIIITGWTGIGPDPDDLDLWSSIDDQPGRGFNFVSYSNTELEGLLRQAKTVPGCSPDERGPLYRQVQTQLNADLPYLFLYIPFRGVAWNTRLGGLDPGPWSTFYNIEQWYIVP